MPLGSVVTILGGGTPSKAEKSFWNGPIPWASVRDLKDRWLTSTEFQISEQAIRASASRIVPAGNVVICSRVGLGKVVQARFDLAINQDLKGLIPKEPTVLDPNFVFYWYKSIAGRVIAMGTGATVQGVRLDDISSLLVPLPPLDEQKRIVAKLDEAQSNLERLTENHENQMVAISALGRSALDQQMTLGQSEPRFSGAGSADTPVDSEPLAAATDWPKVRLGDVAQILNGRAYAKEELLESGRYRVLRVGNFFSNRSWFWSDLELAADKYCEPGDLLYAWSASFGPRIWAGDRSIFHYHIWNIKEDATAIDRRFLFWWLTWDVEKIKAAAGTGSTMMHVTKGSMESRVLALPPLIEQRNLVAKLDGLQREQDSYRKSLDQRRSLASALRDKILASTFSGDI